MIVAIALGIVLAVIILAVLPGLIGFILMLVLILLGLALLACLAVLIWHYPVTLAFMAIPVVIVGFHKGCLYLWKRLPSRAQRRVRLFGWGAPAFSLTGVWAFMLYYFATGQVKASRIEGWLLVLLVAAPAVYFWFEFYRTWKRPVTD